MKTVEERFWAKVRKGIPGECWVWTASASRPHPGHTMRYGMFWDGKRQTQAHRYSYKISKGPIPAGKVVRHTCDNGLCVNPAHLLTGTQKDNGADMSARGRGTKRRGSAVNTAQLDEREVSQIKSMLLLGIPRPTIQARFKVSATIVGGIARGKTWKHVPALEKGLSQP